MASRIAFRLQAGGHRQSRLMICTFHLGFSLDIPILVPHVRIIQQRDQIVTYGAADN